MKLNFILENIEKISVKGISDIDISNINHDSRKITNGGIFIAISGLTVDGNNYIEQAVKNGAKAIVTEKAYNDKLSSVCQIMVADASKALAEIASCFYGNPSNKLNLIGITGTNGKTTITYIMESILKAANYKSGIMGTICNKIGDKKNPSSHTTPDAIEFHGFLHKMVQEDVKYGVLEISSHSIAQKRVLGTKFSVAVFTNLTHDHLDYHKTMEDYGNTKLELFSKYLNSDGTAVVNFDDPFSEKIINLDKKTITYGFSRGSNITAFNLSFKFDGTSLSILTPEGIIDCYVKLIGMFNVYNIMASVGAALALNINLDVIKKGLESIDVVPGRFEYVIAGQPFFVVVDYAHTPDGLIKVLETIRSFFRGKLIVVFGATGDRDKSKRPDMSYIVANFSDFAIITSDDPHAEDPESIINEVSSGIPKDKIDNFLKIVDRKQAIEKAIKMACPGDFILIAGKGHETKQIFKNKEVDHNDKEFALKILKK